jgi:Ca2+-binding EF-hand superfamily protein
MMSISAMDGSSTSSACFSFQGAFGSSQTQRPEADEVVSSIFEQDDADGDGLLSLEETPLDEDRFSSIDTDGDGFISSEELSSDMQAHMEQSAAMGQLSVLMQTGNVEDMVSSIFEQDDADGDGLLSFEETPLDEEHFNIIDSDGDGYITAEELSADMQDKMAEGVMPPPSMAEGAEQTAAASSGSSGSSGETDEEEYDEYDLNEDGVVSVEELLQAFNQGDTEAASQLQNMGEGLLSAMSQRFATQAYQQQQQLI